MPTIPLTCGYVALVDDEDLPALMQHAWRVKVAGRRAGRRRAYAVRTDGPDRPLIRMHRVIMNARPGELVDHREHRNDKVIDNRRGNLRFATATDNNANRAGGDRCSSVFKGVHYARDGRPWQAVIDHGRKRHYRGRFSSEGHAALAYDLAAVRLHGEFAVTNFPVPGSTRWLYGPPLFALGRES